MKADHLFHFTSEFALESGRVLPGFQLKYTTLGQLNADRSNVVWVCHALTGSSDVTAWWGDFFSEGSPYDPRQWFIICANVLGGCYGSTGPLSINPATGRKYFHDFPLLTNRDVVRAFDLLRQHLGLGTVHTLIGGSLGGQQALEWAIIRPGLFTHLIAIACNATHSPWGIAFNEAQRMAIEADPTWQTDDERAGVEGMKAARAIAMISYRTYRGFQLTQAEKTNGKIADFRAASYLRYQGQKLASRFNAFTYHVLSKMMDSHHVGRGRSSVEAALGTIHARTLLVAVEGDLLFPASEQEFLAARIARAQLARIHSHFGHDGFLVEFEALKSAVFSFLQHQENEIIV
jgi:homoserine O-acetyltransferase